LKIADGPLSISENGNSQLAIENALETPKRGQGAECPDRIFTKSGLFLRQIFWE
jgi:hypothetical protein